jgi:hypothetical protein
MAKTRTRDGLSISRIVKILGGWGVDVRDGTKHPHIANYDGMRPCPIASSTDAERMLSPWLSQALGRNRREIYQELRQYC